MRVHLQARLGWRLPGLQNKSGGGGGGRSSRRTKWLRHQPRPIVNSEDGNTRIVHGTTRSKRTERTILANHPTQHSVVHDRMGQFHETGIVEISNRESKLEILKILEQYL